MIVHAYKNKRYGMGLGDFIRGSLSCYQLCRIYGIPLVIDFRHHPIGQYISMPQEIWQYHSDQIVDLQDIKRFTVACLKYKLIKKFKNIKILRKKNAYIYTNVWPRFPLAQDEKDFAKSFLLPTEELEAAIQCSIPTRAEYEIVHIRSGDLFAFDTQVGETFERSTSELVETLKTIEEIKRSTTRDIVVMSDSAELKKVVSHHFGILAVNTVPTHCALELVDAKDTLVDYFILSRAKHIHQFSVHHWGSGFSDTVNWVYDVPISKYKL
jgi:hypothetical protein